MVKHNTLYIVFSMEKLILYILITLWTLLKMKFLPSLYPSLWPINPGSLVLGFFTQLFPILLLYSLQPIVQLSFWLNIYIHKHDINNICYSMLQPFR